MRDTKVPFEVVKALLDQQNAFNEKLIDLVGQYLEKTALQYREALNPPMDNSPDVEMSYSRLDEAAEDLQYQIDTGMISPSQITDQMRRLLGDTEVSIEP